MIKLIKNGKYFGFYNYCMVVFHWCSCLFYFSELIKIDELIGAVRKLQNIPDEYKLQQISEVLDKIDDDHDGSIRLDTVLKVSCLI